MSSNPSRLQEVLGHFYNNKALLEEALTHSSAEGDVSYQRLEFLGDRVLGLVIADFLLRSFPDENEGDLARRLSGLVDKTMLARVAIEAEIGKFILMSEGEKAAGGDANENILADVMEALIGAAYLDAGLETCRKMIESLWGDRLFEMVSPPIDPKTELQEWTQGRGMGLPQYELVGRTGPDHAPVFDIRANIESYPPVVAQGTSRRAAEKAAAELMLASLQKERQADE